jgi:chaperonin cofactor prefoldin
MLRSGSRVHVAEREAETIRREAQIELASWQKLRAEIENEVQDRRTVAARIEEQVTAAEHEVERKHRGEPASR